MNDIMKDLFMELYKEKYGAHINQELAESLAEGFAVTDGSSRENGIKWTMSETKEVGLKVGVDFDKINKCEWFLVMNMVYSDHYRTAKKRGLTEPTFFADLALDWFMDADAKPEKTFNYFMQ